MHDPCGILSTCFTLFALYCSGFFNQNVIKKMELRCYAREIKLFNEYALSSRDMSLFDLTVLKVGIKDAKFPVSLSEKLQEAFLNVISPNIWNLLKRF